MCSRRTKWTLPLVYCIALLSLGCPHPFYRYKGDGKFQDTWIGYPGVRYWLILDHFNTSQTSSRTFSIGKLLEGDYHISFYLAEFDEKTLFDSNHDPVPGLAMVRIKLTDNAIGKILYEEKGSLSDRPWQLSMDKDIKRTNDSPSVSIGNFTPQKGHTYTLKVAIEQPDKIGLDLELRVTGCPAFHYGSL